MQFGALVAERRLVLACALAPPEIDLSAACAREVSAVRSWEQLARAAASNQVRPQLATRLRGLPSDTPASDRAVAGLEEAFHANLGAGAFMTGELLQVLDALEGAGVSAVPFKGPVFAAFTGRSAGMREMSDLDVLVPPEEVVRCVAALAPLGYECRLPAQALASSWLTKVSPELMLIRRGGFGLLELHWALAPPFCPACCSPADIFPHLLSRDFHHRRVAWPTPEALLLMHISDGVKSCGRGVRWLGDVADILRTSPDLQWDRLRAIAHRNRGLNAVRIALAAIQGISAKVASLLDVAALAVELPPLAQTLANEALGDPILHSAVSSITWTSGGDFEPAGAAESFRWSLRVADRRWETAVSIVRYLSGPTVADLRMMANEGDSDLALRWRALHRRLGASR